MFLEDIHGPKKAASGKKGGFSAFLKLIIGLGADGTVSAEDRLKTPTGLHARGGYLYAADPGQAAVFRYELATGKARWLPRGSGPRLVNPVSVAAAADGRVFVLDSALGKVFILDKEGRVKGELEGDPQGMGRPAALTISDDRLYVSDVRNHRIAVYGLEGTFLAAFGRRGAGAGEFNFPTYLHFDLRRRQLWVCDSGNFRVQWFDPDGRHLGTMGESGNRPGYLARPRGLARDSDGDVFVVDAAFDAFQVFDPKGRLLLFVGQAGPEPGQFNLPGGVTIDDQDRVFVADTYNSRIQSFQYLKESAQ